MTVDHIECQECQFCGIELGEGRGRCKRAVDTDLCFECAVLYDPPMTPDEIDAEVERRGERSQQTGPNAWEGGFAKNH